MTSSEILFDVLFFRAARAYSSATSSGASVGTSSGISSTDSSIICSSADPCFRRENRHCASGYQRCRQYVSKEGICLTILFSMLTLLLDNLQQSTIDISQNVLSSLYHTRLCTAMKTILRFPKMTFKIMVSISVIFPVGCVPITERLHYEKQKNEPFQTLALPFRRRSRHFLQPRPPRSP